MADRKVSYILEVDYEAETAVLRARQDLDALGESGRAAAADVEQTSTGLGKVGTAAVAVGAGLVAAGAAFDTVANAAGRAYEILGEGASLSKANSDFEAFAENIGTTASALENDLTVALGGLITTSEQAEAATALISQGLAKNHDEVVALSEVSGRLGWDMQILGTTLNNLSFARLDTLGLSAGAVEERMAALEEQGYATEEAFKWAIIEEGRAKLEITGDIAETAAGQLEILEAITREAQQQFAMGSAEGFADALGLIAENAALAGPAIGALSYGVGGAIGSSFGAALDAMYQLNPQIALLIAQQLEARLEAEALNNEMRGREAYYLGQRAALEDLNAVTEYSVETMKDWEYQASINSSVTGYNIEALKDWQYQMEIVSGLSLAQMEAGMEAQQGLAVETAEAWQAYTAQMTQAGASNFTQYANQVDEGTTALESMDEIMYEIAQKHGAGIDFLGDFGVDAGLISEEAAAAGEAMAQQIQIAESLAAAVERGVMAWDDYPAAVERALAALESGEAARPGGGRPSGAQIYEPGAEPTGAAATGQGYTVPLEVELVDEAIQQAVDEARGIVEGFTSPEEAYEAVMTMNIDDVREKGGEVESLIARLPNQKRITIDVSLVGLDQLQQLQNLGVLP